MAEASEPLPLNNPALYYDQENHEKVLKNIGFFETRILSGTPNEHVSAMSQRAMDEFIAPDPMGQFPDVDLIHGLKTPWQTDTQGLLLSTPQEKLLFEIDFLRRQLGFESISKKAGLNKDSKNSNKPSRLLCIEGEPSSKAALWNKLIEKELEYEIILAETKFRTDMRDWATGFGKANEYANTPWAAHTIGFKENVRLGKDKEQWQKWWWVQAPGEPELKDEEVRRIIKQRSLVGKHQNIYDGMMWNDDKLELKSNWLLTRLQSKTPETDAEIYYYYKYIVKKAPLHIDMKRVMTSTQPAPKINDARSFTDAEKGHGEPSTMDYSGMPALESHRSRSVLRQPKPEETEEDEEMISNRKELERLKQGFQQVGKQMNQESTVVRPLSELRKREAGEKNFNKAEMKYLIDYYRALGGVRDDNDEYMRRYLAGEPVLRHNEVVNRFWTQKRSSQIDDETYFMQYRSNLRPSEPTPEHMKPSRVTGIMRQYDVRPEQMDQANQDLELLRQGQQQMAQPPPAVQPTEQPPVQQPQEQLETDEQISARLQQLADQEKQAEQAQQAQQTETSVYEEVDSDQEDEQAALNLSLQTPSAQPSTTTTTTTTLDPNAAAAPAVSPADVSDKAVVESVEQNVVGAIPSSPPPSQKTTTTTTATGPPGTPLGSNVTNVPKISTPTKKSFTLSGSEFEYEIDWDRVPATEKDTEDDIQTKIKDTFEEKLDNVKTKDDMKQLRASSHSSFTSIYNKKKGSAVRLPAKLQNLDKKLAAASLEHSIKNNYDTYIDFTPQGTRVKSRKTPNKFPEDASFAKERTKP